MYGGIGFCGRSLKNHVERNSIKHNENTEDAQQEAEVTDAINDKGFNSGCIGRGLFEPKPDEQVRNNAHAFPAEEQLHEVVSRHQHQHGESEQRQIGHKAWLAIVVVHIAHGINMNQRRDAGDGHHHDGGQRIEPQRPVGLERARCQPCGDRQHLVFATQRNVHKNGNRADGGDTNAQASDDVCTTVTNLTSKEACDERAKQGHKDGKVIRHVALAFHLIDVFDLDRAAVAVEHHNNGEPNGRLGRSDGQHEHREDLPGEVVEE